MSLADLSHEASPPPIHGWEVDEDFVTYFDGQRYIAVYRDEEPDEFNGEAYGESLIDRDLAIADLVGKRPREA